jgi:hypothetical protein
MVLGVVDASQMEKRKRRDKTCTTTKRMKPVVVAPIIEIIA